MSVDCFLWRKNTPNDVNFADVSLAHKRCSTLQHGAHCNTLQHAATHLVVDVDFADIHPADKRRRRKIKCDYIHHMHACVQRMLGCRALVRMLGCRALVRMLGCRALVRMLGCRALVQINKALSTNPLLVD